MFNDQVVVVTGAGQGIGAEIAKEFAQDGAQVVIVDFNEETAQKTAEAINENSGKAVAYQADVSDFDRAEEIIADVVEKYGKVDVLINNAGITRDASLKKMTKEQWDQVIATNLTGVFNYSKAAFIRMTAAGYGRIVNASSLAGVEGNFGQTNYSASKAGIIGMTKTIAREGAAKGVTVNAVAPGFIETPMTDAIPEEIKQNMIDGIPVKRIGYPKDIANAMKFLASPDSGYITGQLLQVNGGMNM
ncbi:MULTISPECIES: 3-oxoacyl-ACP reductase FabG [Aerococcus]|uniref:3-oxoacyl-ACP reductase FabG n=1 Tax=Aerococcus TaxID=1375 RepID=UPI0018A79A82|nr:MULTISPECIES: 3-oxoacyl-ACP reductase FabG [Aerococcus]MCY3035814.1 3-oxoacyl-ACP reductase FabG [Aerococcus sp. Group 2]MCY3038909.1 3-oxoacyl-ACP reductase FabG [Aerococcus sp. Group 2]MCY3042478.1 3-oxoacyl-ACP reductase FabG [Aerococcus sp. Group 2]MDK6519926.1 3-oxoacyl-ACP reductase FabG [Aerococcus urinae]